LSTTLNITNNPKKLKIIKINTPQLTHTLNNPQIYLSIINNNFTTLINLSTSHNKIFIKNKTSPYINTIITHKNNKNNPNIQKLKKTLQSQPIL
ncbi:methionine ABC transporter substrate-binding protein MetQ, partial [Enterococcus hirae]